MRKLETNETLALFNGTKVRSKPFIGTAVIGEEEKQRVNDVLKSGNLSGFIGKAGPGFLGGPQVNEFESIVRDFFCIPFAIAVNSATAGLHAALCACCIKEGDEVIVPPYTMSASATAIVMQNATPVFVDVEDHTFGIDPQKLEKKITNRTRAIVVVHLFGHPAQMDEIMSIAKRHNCFVVEDCAQAPGAVYRDKLVGTIGDIGVFSLNQHKTITCGEGGIAITRDKNLALRMQLVRNHGEAVVGDMERGENDSIIGFNYRMTELEAAVSIGQFKRLETLNDQRIRLAEYLTEQLSKFDALTLPRKENVAKHVYFVYPIRLDETKAGINRDVFVKAISAEGIPFGAGYVKPLYLEPLYQSRKDAKERYTKGICPVCERLFEKEMMLTAVCRHPHTEDDMNDVVRAFEKVFQNIAELKETKL
jgi:perosamine synthetase